MLWKCNIHSLMLISCRKDTLTSLKSVPKSVSRKERPGTLFTCYHAKSDKVALRRKKKKYFFHGRSPFLKGKSHEKPSFSAKIAGNGRNSAICRDFRSFSAIFGVLPRKKASPPCKERPGSVRKSVPPRKERHMERATFRK